MSTQIIPQAVAPLDVDVSHVTTSRPPCDHIAAPAISHHPRGPPAASSSRRVSLHTIILAFIIILTSPTRCLGSPWPSCLQRTFRFRAYLHEHCRAAAGPAWESDLVRILLLPAGIRPVKDVCLVAAAVSAWHRSFPAVRLVIVGPVLDEAYCNDVRHSLKDLSGVYLVPSLSAPQLYAAIQSSCAVINTSISEGQCGVILEAMALGIAVIAREIPQNAALIVHGENGLLFDTPEEFVRVAASLMEDGGLVSKLTTGGLEYVASVHSMESEHASYVDLAGRLTMTS